MIAFQEMGFALVIEKGSTENQVSTIVSLKGGRMDVIIVVVCEMFIYMYNSCQFHGSCFVYLCMLYP